MSYIFTKIKEYESHTTLNDNIMLPHGLVNLNKIYIYISESIFIVLL